MNFITLYGELSSQLKFKNTQKIKEAYKKCYGWIPFSWLRLK